MVSEKMNKGMFMNKLTEFEAFAHAYLKHATAEDQKYLLSINGIVITEEITSVEALNGAIEGTLAINPDSEIKVYQITDYDYVGKTTEEPEEVVEETEEEAEASEAAIGDGSEGEGDAEIVDATEETETVSEPDENPVSEEDTKDSPRSDKSAKKAAKQAKKAAKLAKKAAKAEKKALKAGTKAAEEAVEVAETPVPEPVIEKKTVKKTVTKKTTTTKSGETRAVAKLNKDTDAIIKKYDSISHASEDSGVHSTNISKVCRGIRGSAGGFGWKYL